MFPIPTINHMTGRPWNAVHGAVKLERPSTIAQTTAYSVDFVVPEGVYRIWVSAIGGGADGDSATLFGQAGAAVLFKEIDVVPGQVIPCAIGIGGASPTATVIGPFVTLDPGGVSVSTNGAVSVSPFAGGGAAFNSRNNTGCGSLGSGKAGCAVFMW